MTSKNHRYFLYQGTLQPVGLLVSTMSEAFVEEKQLEAIDTFVSVKTE